MHLEIKWYFFTVQQTSFLSYIFIAPSLSLSHDMFDVKYIMQCAVIQISVAMTDRAKEKRQRENESAKAPLIGSM